MAWTYTDSPSTVTRDAVRALVGDTDSTDPQPLSDNEVAFFLTEAGGNKYLAAALAAEKLAGYYARQADTDNGSLSVSASQRATAFQKTASRLRSRATSGGASMFVGGLSKSGKDALASDADAVQPQFKVGQDDLPYSDDPSYEDAQPE